MADLAKLVEELSALTVLEAAELSKLLEEKWGVSAAAPVAVAAVAGAAAAPAAEAASAVVEAASAAVEAASAAVDAAASKEFDARASSAMKRPPQGGFFSSLRVSVPVLGATLEYPRA